MEKERRRQHVAPALRRVDHMMKRNLEIHVKEKGIDELTMVHGWFLRYLYENREKDIFQKDIEKQFTQQGIINSNEKTLQQLKNIINKGDK